MRKKLITLCSIGVLAAGLASCDSGDGGNRVNLIYSGAASDQTFNEKLFEDFKEYKKSQGDTTEYVIDYVAHGADKVDSEIIDFTASNSPDVYEAAPDKVAILFGKGALAKLGGKYETFVDTEINNFGKANATFNGDYYAYPYTGDNTYYLQYDKSVFTADDVKDMNTLLAKAATVGKKIGYNLEEGFWGVGALFSFGADYNITFDDDGKAINIDATWNTDKGLKAAKAIHSIVTHPAWQNAMEAPTESNNIGACIAGTWDIAAYKKALGSNYGAAPMPKITIDGETKNLGAFVGGKLLGVNPQRSRTDQTRLAAAHELAMYLAGEAAQLKRFEELGWGPCNLAALNNEKVKADPNMVVLTEQVAFGHEQTSTPPKLWDAAATIVASIKESDGSDESLTNLCKIFNDTVKTLS